MTPGTDCHKQRLLAAIRERRLRVDRIGDDGALRIVGAGVHITAASLRYVSLRDLLPVDPVQAQHQHNGRAH